MVGVSERTEAKRERILQAASKVFRRHGFARTSLDLVAQEASMSRPALYNFFEGKDALFAATVLFMGENTVASLREKAQPFKSVRERLLTVCMEWAAGGYDRIQQNPDARDLTDASLPAVRQVYAMVENLLAEIIAQVPPGQSVSREASALAQLLIASMKGAKDMAAGRDELTALVALQIDLVMRHREAS